MVSDTAKPASSQSAKPRLAAASSTAAHSPPELKPSSASKPNSLLGSSLSPASAERRRTMIAEAAYYIAEKRGFETGRDVEDWLLAEKQIDAKLSA